MNQHNSQQQPSASAMKAVRAWYAPAVDDSPMVRELAQIIDAAYAPLLDLVRQAVEAGAIDEVYLSLIRDALGQSTAGGSAKPDKQEGLEEAE